MDKIRSVQAAAYTIPTDFPEADGTIEWNQTTLVVAEASAGSHTGLGYTYADISTAQLITGHLAGKILGLDPMSPAAAWVAMQRSVRNLGREGIAAMAISALDLALWDLKARLLGIAMIDLLGAVRDSIPVYGSGGFTSYSSEQLKQQLGGWVEQGIGAVKMKIGSDPDADPGRVRAARSAIGDADLFVDANGAYSAKQALENAREFSDSRVSWFEEPVSSDDLDGLRFIRERTPPGM